MPGGLVVVLKATGHGPMLERPEEAAALVLTWWRRHLQLTAAGLKVAASAPMATAWNASMSSPPIRAPATAP